MLISPLTSTSLLSRQSSGFLFFRKKMIASVSGAICFVVFFTFSCLRHLFLLLFLRIHSPRPFYRVHFLLLCLLCFYFFRASAMSENLFFHSESVLLRIPMLWAICSSISPSLAQAAICKSPSFVRQYSNFPLATAASFHKKCTHYECRGNVKTALSDGFRFLYDVISYLFDFNLSPWCA